MKPFDEGNVTAMVNATHYKFSTPSLVTIGIFASILSILTIGGNFLVLMSFLVEKSLRTPTNYLIESLAVTDLLIGLLSMSLYTMYVLLGYWPLGHFICDIWLSLDYTVCLTSQYTVFFITLDRFCSVKFPAKYRELRTERVVIGVVIGTWAIPATLFFTIIFGWPYFSGGKIERRKNQCYAEFTENINFTVILTVSYYWSTLVVMVILYGCIYSVALSLQKKSIRRRDLMRQRSQDVQQNTASRNAQELRHITKDKFDQYENADKKEEIQFKENNTPEKDIDQPQVQIKPKTNRFRAYRDSRKTRFSNSKMNRGASALHRVSSDYSDYEQDDFCEKEKKKRLIKKQHNRQKIKIDTDFCSAPVMFHQKSNKKFKDRNWNDSSLTISGEDTYEMEESPAKSLQERKISPDISGLPLDLKLNSSEQYIESPIISKQTKPEGAKYIDPEYAFLFKDPNKKNENNETDSEYPYANPATQSEPPSRSVWNRSLPIMQKTSFKNPPNATSRSVRMNVEKPQQCQMWQQQQQRKELKGAHHLHSDDEELEHACVCRCWQSCSSMNFFELHCFHNVHGYSIRSQGRSENRAIKALRTISLILGAFVVCWTPYHVLVVLKGICEKCVNNPLYDFSYWLCYVNSLINPFCYALANAQIKKTLLRLLRCDFRKK